MLAGNVGRFSGPPRHSTLPALPYSCLGCGLRPRRVEPLPIRVACMSQGAGRQEILSVAIQRGVMRTGKDLLLP